MARPNSLTRSQFSLGRKLSRKGRRGNEGFNDSFGIFEDKIAALEANLLPALGDLLYESIVHGSTLTGSPGQPEHDGDLIRSWELTQPTPTSVSVTTDSPYALKNEDGWAGDGKPYVQRSAKGGRHSGKLTRRGFQRLVDYAANQAMAEIA